MPVNRPRFNETERTNVLNKENNPFGKKHCWHCGLDLEKQNTFHVDHYPVAFRDITHQICWGVRDPKDLNNLVPSCVSCNTSHTHESHHWCGASQCRCKWIYIERMVSCVGWCGVLTLLYLWAQCNYCWL